MNTFTLYLLMLKQNEYDNNIIFIDHQILVYREGFKLCFSQQTQSNKFKRVICEKFKGNPKSVNVLKSLENFIIMEIYYGYIKYKCRLQKKTLQIDKVYQTSKKLADETLYLGQIIVWVQYFQILFCFNNKIVRKVRRDENLKFVGINLLKVFQYQSAHIKDIYDDSSMRFREILNQTNNPLNEIKEIRYYKDLVVFFTQGLFQQIYVTDKECLNTPKGYYCKLDTDKANYNFQDFCRFEDRFFVLINIRNESVRLHIIDDGMISNNNLICMIYNTNYCRFFDGYIYYFEFNKGIKRIEIPYL